MGHPARIDNFPCPKCGEGPSAVMESRPYGAGEIRRRRTCGECSHRWTTREITSIELDRLREAENALQSILKNAALSPTTAEK